jgi:hypothetical protein
VRVPEPAAGAIKRTGGERLLSWARDEATSATVVAGSHRLYAVSASGELTLARPWHLVDAGVWDHDTFMLTVSWVDGQRPAQWVLREPSLLPETLRERVQASVVLAERVALDGGRQARVVIRQDFSTGGLVEQVILGRGVPAGDAEVTAATEAALARLREQVGYA